MTISPPVRSKNKPEFLEEIGIVVTALGSAVVIAPINSGRSGCQHHINAFANPSGERIARPRGRHVSRVDHVATGLGRRNSTRSRARRRVQ